MAWSGNMGIDGNAVVFQRYHVLSVPYTILLNEKTKSWVRTEYGSLENKLAELLKKRNDDKSFLLQ